MKEQKKSILDEDVLQQIAELRYTFPVFQNIPSTLSADYLPETIYGFLSKPFAELSLTIGSGKDGFFWETMRNSAGFFATYDEVLINTVYYIHEQYEEWQKTNNIRGIL